VSPAVFADQRNKGIAPRTIAVRRQHASRPILIVALAWEARGPLNDNMNFAVYASLFNPGGSRRGQPSWRQRLLTRRASQMSSKPGLPKAGFFLWMRGFIPALRLSGMCFPERN